MIGAVLSVDVARRFWVSGQMSRSALALGVTPNWGPKRGKECTGIEPAPSLDRLLGEATEPRTTQGICQRHQPHKRKLMRIQRAKHPFANLRVSCTCYRHRWRHRRSIMRGAFPWSTIAACAPAPAPLEGLLIVGDTRRSFHNRSVPPWPAVGA